MVAADELLELDAVGVLVVLEVLDVPVLVVAFAAWEAVAPWPASTATVPVPTPAIAMSPMVAIATRRLPSSLVLTESPLVAGVCRLRRSFGRDPMDQLCPSRALARALGRPHLPHIAAVESVSCPQMTHRYRTVQAEGSRFILDSMMRTESPGAINQPELTRPGGGPVRALVVDDEATLAELLSMALRYENWDVRTAGDGLTALRVAREFKPDVVVLDVMLPDLDGLEVLRRLHADFPSLPVLFLTAKDAVEDRIAGLTAGGDDYVTKPFSLEEVVARVRGLLRRAAVAAKPESRLVVGDLVMDEDSREVERAGDLITLTTTEFELLRFFMRNPRRVLSKAQILDRVWQYDFGGQANVVELYVSYLRKKIDVGREPMIHTVRGAGYVLKPAR